MNKIGKFFLNLAIAAVSCVIIGACLAAGWVMFAVVTATL